MALSLPLSTEKLIQLGEVLCQHFPEMNLDEITQQIEQEATDLTTPIGQINYVYRLCYAQNSAMSFLSIHLHTAPSWSF